MIPGNSNQESERVKMGKKRKLVEECSLTWLTTYGWWEPQSFKEHLKASWNASQNHPLGKEKRKHLSVISLLHWSRARPQGINTFELLSYRSMNAGRVLSYLMTRHNRSPPAGRRRCSVSARGNVLTDCTWLHLVEDFMGASLHN